MFGHRFFGRRMFGARFYGDGGVPIDVSYFGGRYFGARYFGQRYWSAEPSGIPGTFFGARYFGLKFYGRRYFGTKGTPGFGIAQTTGPSLTGTLALGSASFTFSAVHALAQTGTLGLAGALSVGGSLTFENSDFSLTPPIDLPGLTGTALVSGNITITGGGPPALGSYWGKRFYGNRFYGGRYFGRAPTFPLTSSTGVALTGAVGVAGGIDTTIAESFSTLGLSGTLGVAGNITIVLPPELLADPEPIGGGRGRRRPRPRTGDNRSYINTPEEDDLIHTRNEQVIELVTLIVASGALD